MEFYQIWTLRGPNVWSRSPVLEAEVDLKDLPPPGAITGFNQRLHALLPWDVDGETRGPHWIHLLGELTIRLQQLLGCEVSFAGGQELYRHGLARVVVEYEEEKLGQACLETVRDLCLAAVDDRPFDSQHALRRLRDLANEVRLGPSTRAIVQAARRRGIPTRQLGDGSLIQLGYGIRQRRILTAETDRTSAVGQTIAQDKDLTRLLLRKAGVPVPEGRPIKDAADAWQAAEELGVPVVVKPQYGNQGRGVITNLRTSEQVTSAFTAAGKVSSHLLVERHIEGDDYRLLVIGNKLAAAALREPAHVIGDGVSTIAQLVDKVNRDPRRSDGHGTSLSRIQIDDIALTLLSEQGYGADSAPPANVRVLLRRNGNLSTGGTATDVTHRVHPRVAISAIEAAAAVGLDIAGVDIVATDIGRPLAEQNAAVVEVNAGPGLRMHLEPSFGTPRPVGDDIVSLLFGEQGSGARGQGSGVRNHPVLTPDSCLLTPVACLLTPATCPIVAVTGVNGKTTTTRLIAHILQAAGTFVGMTCTDGTFMGGRCTEARDCSGPRSARNVLFHPRVEAAVLETARGGILREGLGFERCDVAVVTNLGQGDHFGLRGVETLDDLARVKRVVVEAVADTGTAVLNAHDPLVVAMAEHCPGSIVYFARSRDQVTQRSGRRVFVDAGRVILAGETEHVLMPLFEIPLTRGGGVGFQVENALAATAAVWALGVPLDAIRTGLATFAADAERLPGRFNEFHLDTGTVVIDYAHNPSAVAALVDALAHFPQPRRTAVFSGCNRRDADVIAMGQSLGHGFDRVILYKDWGHSGRSDGELNTVLRQGLARGSRVRQVVDAETEREAIDLALDAQKPDELVVLCIDAVDEAIRLVQGRLGGSNQRVARPESTPEGRGKLKSGLTG